jgi:signal transduction histidine kinase
VDQLRQSLGLLQLAFDSASDAMLILDAGVRVRWANQRAAQLWADGFGVMLPGKSVDDLLTFHSSKGDPILFSDPHHPLVMMEQGDGSARFLLSRAVQVPGKKSEELLPWMVSWRKVRQRGHEDAILLTFRELGPAELALNEQQKLINQLAHEVRTPLSIVLGSLTRVDRDPGLKAESQSHLKVACEEVKRVERVLDNLAVLTQLESGTYPWSFESVCLKTSIQAWLRKLDPSVKARIQLGFEDPAAGQLLLLDVQALTRVLNELLDNSLRYSAASLPIELRGQVVGKALELLFVDWGTGIPHDRREQVFQRFIRLERHRDSSRSDGAGLGLAVVRRLMQGMNGDVAVMSHLERTKQHLDGQESSGGTIMNLSFPIARS